MVDKNSFATDVAAARGYLMRFARLQLHNATWAEDVVSETLIAALEKPEAFAGKSSLKTWLVGILKYKIIDCLRANTREISAEIIEDEGHDVEAQLFTSAGHFINEPYHWDCPEQSLRSKQFLQMLELCLEGMPATMGRVFLMREWLEYSTEEICKELHISLSNVWVLLHRARLRLRECLQNKWFAEKAMN